MKKILLVVLAVVAICYVNPVCAQVSGVSYPRDPFAMDTRDMEKFISVAEAPIIRGNRLILPKPAQASVEDFESYMGGWAYILSEDGIAARREGNSFIIKLHPDDKLWRNVTSYAKYNMAAVTQLLESSIWFVKDKGGTPIIYMRVSSPRSGEVIGLVYYISEYPILQIN